jgi:hypothetical protein
LRLHPILGFSLVQQLRCRRFDDELSAYEISVPNLLMAMQNRRLEYEPTAKQ